MYSRGFRPTASQGHKNTFAFMAVALGDRYSSLIGYFDRMRTKRNQAIYDVAGLITEKEAQSILRHSTEFVETMKAKLSAHLDSKTGPAT